MQQTERFVKGAIILSLAGVIAKFVSVFYKIPLNRLVGDEGIGHYQTIFPIFSILISAGLIGIPNAVSKLIAEDVATGNMTGARKTFKDTLLISIGLGLLISFFMFAGTNSIIQMTGKDANVKYVIWGFAISPLFVFVTGAFKGYFQGFQEMLPTAISQIIENFTKVIIGITLVALLMGQGTITAKAVGGAALGTSIGYIVSTLVIISLYLRKHKKLERNINEQDPPSERYSFKKQFLRIFEIALPVSIAAAVFSIMNAIDNLTLYDGLAQIGYNSKYAAEVIGKMANAYSVINFPLVISVALSISVVPAISESAAVKDFSALQDKIHQGLKLAIMLALPAAVGLFMLAKPIMFLLYPNSPDSYIYLQMYSICLIFMIVGQTLAGILQGISKQYIPILALGIAVVVKVVLNEVWVPTSLKGLGAALASIVYYGVILVINYGVLKKVVRFKIDKIKVLANPLLATGIMLAVVYFAFPAIMTLFTVNVGLSVGISNAIATLLTVFVGILFYFGVLLFSKTFTVEELSLLPKHTKIIRFLQRKNLV